MGYEEHDYLGLSLFLWGHLILFIMVFSINTLFQGSRGGVVVKALRYRQDAGSIPDGVIGIFQWQNPSGLTMALGSTQPLTEMSTRCISWG